MISFMLCSFDTEGHLKLQPWGKYAPPRSVDRSSSPAKACQHHQQDEAENSKLYVSECKAHFTVVRSGTAKYSPSTTIVICFLGTTSSIRSTTP